MISKTGLHAIRALTLLAQLPEGCCSGAAALAERIGGPPNYLGKLLQRLGGQGLVQSQKGSGGGFRLARHPDAIRLLDVIEPIEHVSRWTACFLGGATCSDATPCVVHERWVRARQAYLELLSATTIADLVAGRGASPSARQEDARAH